MTFKNKVAFIAGGTGGLGRAVSQAFLAEAATVVVTYRKKQELDELKNAAGIHADRLFGYEIDVTDEAAIAKCVQSILKENGELVPAMLKQGSGAIVNVASKAALDHAAGASAYVATKAAAVAMMDSLAADLKGSGVRVNSILPSIIDTPANRKAMPGADFAKWPKPEEIARVILFLCSDDARVVHGAAIPVYGAS